MTIEKLTENTEILAECDGLDKAKAYFRDICLREGYKWRVNNLYRVRDKLTGKAVPFKLNPQQSYFLNNRAGRDLILKPRQEGFTTLACVIALDGALWEANMTTGIMAHKQDVVKTIFEDIVKYTYRWFVKDWSHYYKPTEKSDSATTLAFQDDGQGNLLQTTMRVLFDFRGKTVRKLHVSEAPRVQSKRLIGSLQAVPATGDVTLEGTAHGMGNDFYEQYQNFKKMGEQAPYKAFFFPWWQFYPEDETDSKWQLKAEATLTEYEQEDLSVFLAKVGYNDESIRCKIAWRRWCIIANCAGDEDVFEAEYPTNDEACFYAGSGQVFKKDITVKQAANCYEPRRVGFLVAEGPGKVVLHEDKKGITSLWLEPVLEHSYVIGADPAGGVGRDFAAAYVLDQKTGELVARIWGQVEPSDFASELHKLAVLYNKAWVCPEVNNHGHVVVHVLKEKRYAHVYRRKAMDELSGTVVKKRGFVTSNESKIVITEKLKKALREGTVKILDKALIAELTSFLQVSSETGRSVRREAPSGAHDDLVMAAAFTVEMHSARPMSSSASEPLNAILSGRGQFDETGFPV